MKIISAKFPVLPVLLCDSCRRGAVIVVGGGDEEAFDAMDFFCDCGVFL